MWILRERTIGAAFALAVMIFVTLSSLSYRTMRGLLSAEASTFHTYDVIETLDNLFSDIGRAESDSRGFLLSADQRYLDDYSAGRAQIDPRFQQLERLTVDNPVQQKSLADLRTSLNEKIAFMDQAIALRSKNDLEGTLKLMGSRQGRALMDDIQQRIDQITMQEKSLLQLRTALAQSDARWLSGVLLLGSVVSLGILSTVFIHLVREVRRRRTSEASLQQVNHLFYILSQSNQAIVRLREVGPLLDKVCRITVERSFFNLACVGLIDPDTQTLKLVAASEDEFLTPERQWLPSSDESGFICNDIAADPRTLPEREKALAQGFRSAGVFPLRKSGAFSGIFCVYASEPNVFANDIVALLSEVAEDISFALQSIQDEQKRKHAEEEIRRLNHDLESKVKERTADLAVLNRTLEDRNKELTRASQLKSEFVSRMSHELRTPLNAMTGYLDLLAEESAGDLNAKQKRYVGHIRTGAAHLLELVNEVLDLSKIEAGRIELYSEWFKAGDALLEILTSTQALATARNISVEHTLDTDLLIYADHLRFKQILYNLISNALKFTPEGGHVRIDFEERDDSVYVSVIDNGIGIPPEEQQAIFDEFHQAVTARGIKEGTGLGLAITKHLIEQQGGRIWVKSEPGHGSQFTFTVPSRQAGVAGAEA
jgi:signal transduction histidine kinase